MIRKIIESWKKIHKKEKLKRKLDEYLEEKERNQKERCFFEWKKDVFAAILAAEAKADQFIQAKLLSKYFLILYEYKNANLIQKYNTQKAYLHLKRKIESKAFKRLCYATFERGKRQM